MSRTGLFVLVLGPMLVVFRGADYWGQAVTAVGVTTCAYGVHRYLLDRRVFQSAVQLNTEADESNREESGEGEPGIGSG